MEKQLAYTQHAGPVPPLAGPPPLPTGPPPPPPGGKRRGGGDGESSEDGSVEQIGGPELNYIINTDQFITTGTVEAQYSTL